MAKEDVLAALSPLYGIAKHICMVTARLLPHLNKEKSHG